MASWNDKADECHVAEQQPLPTVSIIVPVYNGQDHLEDCLYSLVRQQYPKLEIVIVNDGSTDSSQEIIDLFAQTYPHIVSLSQENQGVSAARNLGVKRAAGDLVMFVDSDDLLLDGAVDTAVAALQSSNAECVNFCYQYQYGDGAVAPVAGSMLGMVQSATQKRQLMLALAAREHPTFVWLLLVPRHLAEQIGFDQSLTFGEDLLFFLSLISVCESIFCEKAVLYQHRHNLGSATNDPVRAEAHLASQFLQGKQIAKVLKRTEFLTQVEKQRILGLRLQILVLNIVSSIAQGKLNRRSYDRVVSRSDVQSGFQLMRTSARATRPFGFDTLMFSGTEAENLGSLWNVFVLLSHMRNGVKQGQKIASLAKGR